MTYQPPQKGETPSERFERVVKRALQVIICFLAVGWLVGIFWLAEALAPSGDFFLLQQKIQSVGIHKFNQEAWK